MILPIVHAEVVTTVSLCRCFDVRLELPVKVGCLRLCFFLLASCKAFLFSYLLLDHCHRLS